MRSFVCLLSLAAVTMFASGGVPIDAEQSAIDDFFRRFSDQWVRLGLGSVALTILERKVDRYIRQVSN